MKKEMAVEVVLFLAIFILFGGNIIELIKLIFDIAKFFVWDIILSNLIFFQ